MIPPAPILAAEDAVLLWRALPAPWVIGLVVVPAAVVLVTLAYRREDVPRGRRLVLAALRLLVLLAATLLLFGPYMERKLTRRVRSHVAVLLDTSASMEVADDVDPGFASDLSRATGVPFEALPRTPRFELARRALLEGGAESVLERLRKEFVVHVYGFAAEPRPAWSGEADREEGDAAASAAAALRALRPDGASTRIGDSLVATLEDFRLRDEPLAAVVLVSDGRSTGGGRTPREAAEVARAFLQKGFVGERGIPVHPVLAGDPSSARNVQVRNLVAPEVVLANDDASFEFDVVETGFDGQSATLRLRFVEPPGENAVLTPESVALKPGEAGTRVKARYRFTRPGPYRLMVGVPPLPGERVSADNWAQHHVRVVDRKVKVLYVDGRPRREWEALQRALTRDADTMLVHTLQLESARDVPQARTEAPGWPALRQNLFPRTRAELFEYDVIILGDADWRDFGDSDEEALRRVQDIRDFVEAGGGLLCIAGEYHMPLSFRRTALDDVLPVVVDADEVLRARVNTGESFNIALTAEGRESPILRIHEDGDRSAELWERMGRWQQWWYFPARRVAAGARALAVHPEGVKEATRGEEGRHANRFGPHVLLATRTYGLGRSLWVGVEELWRMRYGVGDQFYYDFYAKAVRYLASYRLLGGNKRVKLHPERQVWFLDESVAIVAHVVGEDYRPPSPHDKPVVKVLLRLPDGREESMELTAMPQPEGEAPTGVYRGTVTATLEGTYTVAPDPAEVPGETPEEKSFVVQASAEERKDPSVDEESMRTLAAASGTEAVTLADIGKVPERIRPRDYSVPVDARPDPLSDQWWVPVLLTCLLAVEWILRKSWRLL